MSGLPRDQGFSLVLGDSRLGRLPDGWERTVVFPAGAPLLKQERQTLIWRVEMPAGAWSVVKMYRLRGRCSRLRGRLVPYRVQREFDALTLLADAAIPCSAPWLWGHGRAAQHGDFELLVTSEIAGSITLKQRLADSGAPLGAEAWLPLFESLRRMHGCGLYHGALWPKNILVTRAADGAWQFHLIDLARAVRFPGTIQGTSLARFDLLSLLYSVGRADAGFDFERMLRHYGYAVAEARSIAAQARRYRSSRHVRNRLAVTSRLRATVAWWTRGVFGRSRPAWRPSGEA